MEPFRRGTTKLRGNILKPNIVYLACYTYLHMISQSMTDRRVRSNLHIHAAQHAELVVTRREMHEWSCNKKHNKMQ